MSAMTGRVIVLIFSLFFEINCWKLSDPLISTNLGVIRGQWSEDGNYKMFLGIPYALVNETNPFGASLSHPGFNETFNANNDSVVCPQTEGDTPVGELQCLRLNIYVPSNASSTNKLPVMIWIHGGAFVMASSTKATTGPDFIVHKQVIMVTLQYRLGVYGFLCLATREVPGNQGLKDQALGFKWIYENIGAFGGNKNSITVFGNSAGAASIALHVLTNRTQYFQRAILQSGGFFTTWLLTDANVTVPIDIASSLNYTASNLSDALTFLAEQNPQTIAQKAFDLNITNSRGTNLPLLKVCIETEFDCVDSFLVDYPMNIESSRYKPIPMIMGFNDNELSTQYGNAPPQYFENYSFGEYLAFDMKGDIKYVDDLQHYYIGDEDLGYNVKNDIIDFGTDYVFAYSTERMIQKLTQDGSEDIYEYLFSYSGKRNLLKVLMNITAAGAGHADETGYLFVNPFLKDATNEADMKMVDILTTLWTNFAKYGNPTPEETDLIPFIWAPVTNTTRPYLSLNTTLEMKKRPFSKNFAFWDLFYGINHKNLIGYKSC